ncbi:MAG: TIGR04219 family outer membrane beta-barrel protein [Campylobacterota bacterium]|nr:TIGR04219 family outer membrane beta-barrel protein [Campylobacterota bacterium]
MKKLLSSIVVLTTVLTTSLSAGMIIDIDAGIGVWDAAPSGSIKYGSGAADNLDLEKSLGLESSTNTYIYADLNHFVPLIPNVRVEKQELKIDGSNSLGSISFGNKNYTSDVTTTLDLSQTDLIAYWGVPGLNLLSAGILDFNFGVDLKQFSGGVTLKSDNTEPTTADMDFVIPMGYLAASIKPPFIPGEISASYKTISYKSSSISDIMAKISINLPIPLPLIDFKADIGYKEQTLVIDEDLSDSLKADIKFSGMFFGISAKF